MSDHEHDLTLNQLGEFALIDLLTSGRRQPASTALGPGDDAAVVFAGDGRTVVSTDMLVQDRHFRLDWSTPHDVGRKAIAQNAADIEAMGAQATAFVVGVRCARRNSGKAGRRAGRRNVERGAADRGWHRRGRSGQLPAVGGVGDGAG